MNPPYKYPSINKLISLGVKKALVTGGAAGIGFAIIYRLAEAGAEVAIIDANEEKGQLAAQTILNYGFSAFFLKCDVSQEEEVKATVDKAISRMGQVDILINNAGIFPLTPIIDINAGDIEKVLSINLKGVLYFSREVSRWMIKHNHKGCIVNLASIDSIHPSHSGLSIYDASKGAVLTLTKSLARELGPSDIRVNAIAPGGILTEGVISRIGSISGTRDGLKSFLTRIPLGKMGVADDIGRAALFLASDLSSYMTGSLITVDGGYLVS
jgi:2-deoxy-D-gluconate 3-dehydrogenase